MRTRRIAILIITAAAEAHFASGSNAAAAGPRHQPRALAENRAATALRTRHNRQVDVNDVPGHGTWRGCAAPNAIAGANDSGVLVSIYCGRPPVFLASTDGARAAGRGWSA